LNSLRRAAGRHEKVPELGVLRLPGGCLHGDRLGSVVDAPGGNWGHVEGRIEIVERRGGAFELLGVEAGAVELEGFANLPDEAGHARRAGGAGVEHHTYE